MTLLVVEDFESGTVGNDLPDSGPGVHALFGPASTAKYASGAQEGSLCARFDHVDFEPARLQYQFTQAPVHFFDFYMWFDDPDQLSLVGNVVTGSTNRARLRIENNNAFGITNGVSLVAASSLIAQPDTWYRLAWGLNDTLDTQTLRIFHGANINGTVPDEEIGGAYTPATSQNAIWLGEIFGGGGIVQVDYFQAEDAEWPSAPGGGGGSDPVLLGEGTLADRIFASLVDQGFTEGTIVDRERQRLLAKLGLQPTDPGTLHDLYVLADEPFRILGTYGEALS